jgi:hypothetical protein
MLLLQAKISPTTFTIVDRINTRQPHAPPTLLDFPQSQPAQQDDGKPTLSPRGLKSLERLYPAIETGPNIVTRAQTTEEQGEMIADGGQLLKNTRDGRVEVFVNIQQAPTGATKRRDCVDTKHAGIVRDII